MKNRFRTTLLVLLPLLSPPAGAQPEVAHVGPAPVDDEITVLGKRTPASLQVEMVHAAESVFGLFNELNTDNDYDIICRWTTITPSRIRQHVCLTKYFRDALAETAKAQFNGDPTNLSMAPVTNGDRILEQKLITLANEHPELRHAMDKLRSLKDELVAAQRGDSNAR